MPITSPVERISGPSAGSTSGNRLNGSTASLTATWPVTGSVSSPSARSSASVAPSITRVATLASGMPLALATNGTVRLARGLASITYTVVPATANCTLIRPRTSSRWAIAVGVRLDHLDHPVGQRLRRDRARRVAGVHAGLLDVLHHAADQHLAGVIADGVDVDLDGARQEAVDQHGPLGRQPAFRAEAAEPASARPSPAPGGCGRGRSASPARRARSSGARAPGSRSGR